MVYLIIGICIGMLINIGRDYLSFNRGFKNGSIAGVKMMKKINHDLHVLEVGEDVDYTINFEIPVNRGGE